MATPIGPCRIVGELAKLARSQPRRCAHSWFRPPRHFPPATNAAAKASSSRTWAGGVRTISTSNNGGSNNGKGSGGTRRATVLASAAGAAVFTVAMALEHPVADEDGAPEPQAAPPEDKRDPSLPRHRLSEIRANHAAGSDQPWVTMGDKVYDITDWVGAHPGGEVILRAAGGSIEPYWDIFKIHNQPHVREILDQYLVGLVAAEDLDPATGLPAAQTVEDPFKADPARDARLVEHTAKAFNGETPSQELARDFVTPQELFYVRNHMWVPVVDEAAADDYALTVELPDGEERVYTLAELRSRFPTHQITAVLQCSGNRRSDMTASAAKTNGLQWGAGAISNATWEGVRLSDVLRDAGLLSALEKEKDTPETDMHVQFSALETYGASIPLSTAMDPRADVLLAFGMNGSPLPRDHGYPLRTIVPGHVAARSVKWLNKIVVSDEESASQYQRRDYKCFGPNEGDKPDWDRYPSIQEMPVTSAVTGVWVGECVRAASASKTSSWMLNRTDAKRAAPCVRDLPGWQSEHMPKLQPSSCPEASAARSASVPVALAGYAYSGGGKHIVRVDVSVDGGRTWDQAELVDDSSDGKTACGGSKAWAWKRWRYVGSLSPDFTASPKEASSKCTTVMVKAVDSAYNTQPECHKMIYNVRGNLATAWHRVKVCPTCVKTPEGKLAWKTGGIFGSGFGKMEAAETEKKKESPLTGAKQQEPPRRKEDQKMKAQA